MEFAVGLREFPATTREKLEEEQDGIIPSNGRMLQYMKHIRHLVNDCLKKTKERKRARALEAAELGEDVADEVEEEQPAKRVANETNNVPGQVQGWPVWLFIRDPDNYFVPAPAPAAGAAAAPAVKLPIAQAWQDRNIRRMGMIKNPTIAGIMSTLEQAIPEGRSVRSFIGALADPPPPTVVAAADGAPAATTYHEPPDWIFLETRTEVEGWLGATACKPVKILIELHSVAGPNTPPPR